MAGSRPEMCFEPEEKCPPKAKMSHGVKPDLFKDKTLKRRKCHKGLVKPDLFKMSEFLGFRRESRKNPETPPESPAESRASGEGRSKVKGKGKGGGVKGVGSKERRGVERRG